MSQKQGKKATRGAVGPPGRKRTPTRARVATPIRTDETVDLTTASRKLLLVMADPDNLKKSNKELIELAGIGRSRFYELQRSPEFHRKRHQVMLQILGDPRGALYAMRKTAQMLGREGSQDRRMMFELAGFYDKATRIEITTQAEKEGDMPDAVALWYYQTYKTPIEQWIPAIRIAWEQGKLKAEPPRSMAMKDVDDDLAVDEAGE